MKPPRPPSRPRAAPPRQGPAAIARSAPASPRKKEAAAGPPRRRRAAAAPKPAPTATETLDRLQALIAESLDADKAEDIVVLDLAGRAAFTDRMIIATGLADRQIAAMAQHLEEKLREAGLRRVLIEGAGTSDWVLIDAGDIVIHLFKPEAREMYALEKMWGPDLDAPGAEMDGPPADVAEPGDPAGPDPAP